MQSFPRWSRFGFIKASGTCQIPQVHYRIVIQRQKLVDAHWRSNIQVARSFVEINFLPLAPSGGRQLLYFVLFFLDRFDKFPVGQKLLFSVVTASFYFLHQGYSSFETV